MKGDYALFLIDSASGKAVTTPDIAKYGVMNIPTAQRKALLRKVMDEVAPTSYDSLVSAKFDILRYDRTVLASDQTSLDTGVFFIGKLPYGTYYVHEKEYPTNQSVEKNSADTAGSIEGWWYTVTVNASGVSCSGKSATAP